MLQLCEHHCSQDAAQGTASSKERGGDSNASSGIGSATGHLAGRNREGRRGVNSRADGQRETDSTEHINEEEERTDEHGGLRGEGEAFGTVGSVEGNPVGYGGCERPEEVTSDARSLVSIATKGRNAAIQQKEQVEAQCELLRRQIVDLQEQNDNISSLKSIGDTEQTALRQALDRERTEVDGLRKDKAAILEEQSKLRYNLRMENQALTDKVKALETQLRNPSAVRTEATTSQTEFPGAERTDKSSGRILELEEQVRQLGNINDELSQRIMELEEGSSETELEDEESPVREQKGANEPPLETEPTVVDLTNATEVVIESAQEDYGTEGETYHVCGDAAQ